ncbi:hypothetical protein DFH07DRAFT_779481 [Mycena maculata]|uniref:Secreted protein n=1 Tax=Mycena maculata TaxID=230809 RepID=A0AAD7MX83_9AGAR|nr:hypothetical protein DFH07DRAFT_779481 [Mycena maculata]
MPGNLNFIVLLLWVCEATVFRKPWADPDRGRGRKLHCTYSQLLQDQPDHENICRFGLLSLQMNRALRPGGLQNPLYGSQIFSVPVSVLWVTIFEWPRNLRTTRFHAVADTIFKIEHGGLRDTTTPPRRPYRCCG